MQAKSFLIINALIVLALVLRIIIGRRTERPTPLNMTDKNLRPGNLPSPSGEERSLNCYFMFNGMLIEAFEVLGLPAGSDRDACYRAYVDLRRQMSGASPEIIEKAWQALQEHFSK